MTAPFDPAPLRARLEKATPGPWRSTGWHFGSIYIFAPDDVMVAERHDNKADDNEIVNTRGFATHEPQEANADFIAHMPTDAEACLAELDRLRADLDACRQREQEAKDQFARHLVQCPQAQAVALAAARVEPLMSDQTSETLAKAVEVLENLTDSGLTISMCRFCDPPLGYEDVTKHDDECPRVAARTVLDALTSAVAAQEGLRDWVQRELAQCAVDDPTHRSVGHESRRFALIDVLAQVQSAPTGASEEPR